MKHISKSTWVVSAMALAVLAACGGGGSGSSTSSTSTPTTSIAGAVVDGYLSGATVCLDVNKNSVCDSGEPTATTDANGKFTLTGVTTADAAAAPLLVSVPATAVDSDTNAAVGSAYFLMAPAGKTVVTPLTTLVQQAILVDSSLSADNAAAGITGSISSLTGKDLFADYVAKGDSTSHDAAKVLAKSLMANFDAVKDFGSAKARAVVLANLAKQTLQGQGSTPNPSSVSASDLDTLRTAIGAQATGEATQDVEISFDMVNGDTPVRCGDTISIANTALWDHTTGLPLATPGATGAQSTAGQLQDTRFYISNVMLLDANGNAVPLKMTDSTNYQSAIGLALLDFGYLSGAACTSTFNTKITGKVVPGTYTGISMTLGVPVKSADGNTKLNHVNAADTSVPAPLQVTAVNWTWQSGRKFTKIEFKPTTPIDKRTASGSAPSGYTVAAVPSNKWNVHVGSTGCSGDPTTGADVSCTNPNRVSLRFDSFNASTQKVVFNVAQLFKETDLTFEGGGAPGCMSGTTDPECPAIFKALGVNLATGKTLTGTAAQTVLTVKSK